MKKVAIFAEGQTESIFIRELLRRVIDLSTLSYECWILIGKQRTYSGLKYSSPEPKVHFLIIDCGNDERVLTAIKERQEGLITSGFDRIIGLRDMYCEAYAKRSRGRIDDSVTQDFIRNHNAIVRNMTHSDRISLHFAIMEVEAWFLGMYNLFSRINPVLTVECIRDKLNINLTTTDPQKAFYKPSEKVSMICSLCGRSYGKKRGEVESICSKISSEDFENAKENGRCQSFADLYQEMTSYC